MQNRQQEQYWQQLLAAHERTRQLHRRCVVARDALFAHYGHAQSEGLSQLWQNYHDCVAALQDAVADTQTAAGFHLPAAN